MGGGWSVRQIPRDLQQLIDGAGVLSGPLKGEALLAGIRQASIKGGQGRTYDLGVRLRRCGQGDRAPETVLLQVLAEGVGGEENGDEVRHALLLPQFIGTTCGEAGHGGSQLFG